ncbi:enolase C-terminal domain-like protein [Amycolatopsis decaplanina]|uniref:Mandelate racemase/muconate lactonizing enzyme n=1 Tax=Amycolatopsis decaplanina DSM 44594 TaxID=1284240 RepID=M2YUV1_9PSEU|nr:enolase C-terminal domain-like protein [Amycolatopsis decaplanina]EME52483.1 mandelate racemase/muconate lactonizing enzyme [Amycolatopsis decaplanina DSM 44594]
MTEGDAVIESLRATAYRLPTPGPQGDGTLEWNATTIVFVQATAEGATGSGWTYCAAAAVDVVSEVLAEVVTGRSALEVPGAWLAMQRRIRNLGRPGLVSCALSAVDIALWDLAAELAGLPLSRLLGKVHDSAPVYGSGGFTTYDDSRLRSQLEEWVGGQGIPRVKIKIGESWGTAVRRDLARVRLAREVIGPSTELYVDANGAYQAAQAIRVGQRLAESDVRWFEEPVSSDDLAGLRRVRQGVLPDVAAGEYGYDLPYFGRMVAAEAVDCLQIDVTRCGGYTEWARAAAVASTANLQVSAHCAPNLSVHAAVCTPNLRHIEWFVDHDRLERLFFAGTVSPDGGQARPDLSVSGHGLVLLPEEADRYRVR